MSTLDELKRLPAFELARYVDGITDNVTRGTDGAEFLTDVRDAWAEYVESEGSADRDTIERDVLSTALQMPTHTSWQVFTDLAAYNVEPYDSEVRWGSDGDLSNLALAVLVKVASDLLSALSGDLDEDEEESSDDE